MRITRPGQAGPPAPTRTQLLARAIEDGLIRADEVTPFAFHSARHPPAAARPAGIVATSLPLTGHDSLRGTMDETPLETMRSDTCSVSISAPPEFVWSALADVASWPRFSPFATAVTRTSDQRYDVLSPQGLVRLRSVFDRTRLLLDHIVSVHGETEVFVPYRVVPNNRGSELIMTNIQFPHDSVESYEEQLCWMREELVNAKKYVEGLYERSRHDRPGDDRPVGKS